MALSSLHETPVLARLKGVRHRYGVVEALCGVSIDVRASEVLALLGPNGAGKTTALGLLTGLLSVQEGAVELCGGDPRMASCRRQLGAMLQEARLPETLRVHELVRNFSAYYPAARPIEETLSMAGLEGLESRSYGALSGGQQRRVQFALAICGRPRVVLVDEPTVGLDVEARRIFWGVLRQLRQEGVAMVLTTHYLEEADALADRVVVMQKGRVIAEGTPMALKSRQGGTRIRCMSSLDVGHVAAWPSVHSVQREAAHLLIESTEPEATVRELLASDAALSALEVSPRRLEDAFVELMQEAA
jgi:ABC-2 type transport system ATP-binding protein